MRRLEKQRAYTYTLHCKLEKNGEREMFYISRLVVTRKWPETHNIREKPDYNTEGILIIPLVRCTNSIKFYRVTPELLQGE